jgi:hypothetical protein
MHGFIPDICTILVVIVVDSGVVSTGKRVRKIAIMIGGTGHML